MTVSVPTALPPCELYVIVLVPRFKVYVTVITVDISPVVFLAVIVNVPPVTAEVPVGVPDSIPDDDRLSPVGKLLGV